MWEVNLNHRIKLNSQDARIDWSKSLFTVLLSKVTSLTSLNMFHVYRYMHNSCMIVNKTLVLVLFYEYFSISGRSCNIERSKCLSS